MCNCGAAYERKLMRLANNKLIEVAPDFVNASPKSMKSDC